MKAIPPDFVARPIGPFQPGSRLPLDPKPRAVPLPDDPREATALLLSEAAGQAVQQPAGEVENWIEEAERALLMICGKAATEEG